MIRLEVDKDQRVSTGQIRDCPLAAKGVNTRPESSDGGLSKHL